MKRQLVTASVFLATTAAVALYPTLQGIGAVDPPPTVDQPSVATANPDQRPVVEAVFVLDTTSSMSGLIEAAKEKIWSIASTMASAQPQPRIRLGLVAFRDRGDAYVTRLTDLSTDLDSTYAQLMDFRAVGGGDGPESVNQALHDAVHGISWSQAPEAYKVIFLVGDAPPHMDYADDVPYPDTLAEARRRGITVNTIQAGRHGDTTQSWRHIAGLGAGEYFQVDANGSTVALATPFDEKMAELSRELDRTRLYYGSDEERAAKRERLAAAEKLHAGASLASRARRATFNASASGKANLIGERELVDDVVSGRVDLGEVAPETLPAPLQAMPPAEQKAMIEETAERRETLQQQIEKLARQRADYLEDKVAESGGAPASLDDRIYGAIRAQGKAKGLRYESDAPAY